MLARHVVKLHDFSSDTSLVANDSILLGRTVMLEVPLSLLVEA
jgi:hypothetical protein